jgi:hypothetical protein
MLRPAVKFTCVFEAGVREDVGFGGCAVGQGESGGGGGGRREGVERGCVWTGVFFSVMCRYETWSIGRFGVDKALEWRIGRTYFSVAMLSPFLKPHSPFSYVTAIQEGFWEQAVMQLEIEGSCPWSVYN